MSKINCNIIADLLPLYVDGVCSEETKKLVEEHLQSCGQCRETLKNITGTDIDVSAAEPEDLSDEKKIKKGVRKLKRVKYILAAVLIVFFVSIVCVVAAAVNSARERGLTFSSYDEWRVADSFVKALENQDYEKALSYMDLSVLTLDDDVLLEKMTERGNQLAEEGIWVKSHSLAYIYYFEDTDDYEVVIKSELDNGANFIFSFNVSDGKLSPYISSQITANGYVNDEWSYFMNFIYRDY